MNRKNLVAKIMQIYAIVNAIAGVVLMFIIADYLEWTVALIWFETVLVVSFLIYAFGEVVELLTAIKINTSFSKDVVESFELPDIYGGKEMAERFTRLCSLPENLYAEGSPVVVAAGALQKDNQTGKIFAQLKLKNISDKRIKAAKIKIFPLDTANKWIEGEIEHEYLDLNVERDEEFGQKTAVAIPNASTRAFTIDVTQVVFADNSIWDGCDKEWDSMPKPESIADYELLKQYRIKYGSYWKFAVSEHKDLWFCACGALNRCGEKCHICGRELDALKNVSLEELLAERDARLEAERKQAEADRAAAEERAEANRVAAIKRAKKARKLTLIITPIVIIAIIASVLISNVIEKKQEKAARLEAYNQALSLVSEEKYDEAITAFTVLGDYKDCAEQIRITENLKAEAQRAEKYSRAVELLTRSDYQKHAEAYKLFNELGDYKDSSEYLKRFKYVKVDGIRQAYSITNDTKQEHLSSYDIKYIYDEKGQLAIQDEIKTAGRVGTNGTIGKSNTKIESEYDTQGFLKKTIKFSEWDEAYNDYKVVTTTEYDRAGNVIGIVIERVRDKTLTEYAYENELSSEGILTKQKRVLNYYVDFVRTEESVYDSEGRETERSIIDKYRETNRIVTSKYEYDYDSHGNVCLLTVYEDKGQGLVKKGSTSYDNAYDSNGNLISTVQKYANQDASYYEYSYDEDSNKLTYTHKNKNGISFTEEVYNYGYIYISDAK